MYSSILLCVYDSLPGLDGNLDSGWPDGQMDGSLDRVLLLSARTTSHDSNFTHSFCSVIDSPPFVTAVGGYSPAMFALELAQKLPKFLFDFDEESGLEISISRNQPRVEGSVRLKVLGGEPQTVSVKCRLETLSDIRIREVYESATVLSNEVEIPAMLQYTRDMYVTYVDEDILVIRDGSGVPELLVRKEKTFTRNWGTDP